jgi:hypothetical protein
MIPEEISKILPDLVIILSLIVLSLIFIYNFVIGEEQEGI